MPKHTPSPRIISMNPPDFADWVAQMKKQNPSLRYDRQLAEELGVTTRTFINFKKKGCDRRTSLACSALLFKIPPYHEWGSTK